MGISMISDGVTLSMASLRKFAVAITLIVLMTASTLSGRGKARRLVQYDGDLTPTSTVRNDLFGQIRQRVTDMEYPATTAEDLVAIVSRWTTPRGQSVLPVLQGILVRTRQACKEGVISRSQLAQTEEKVVAGLCQSIKAKITYRRDYFDLTTIIETRQANCFGYAQLFCILGNAIGLSASAMNVTSEHVANIVELADGTMTVVDLIRNNGFLSERIITDSEFEGEGSRWTYKDRNHITREDKIIHILDRNELIGEIHFCRGTMQYMSGRGAEAIVHYDRAIELSPHCARAYNNPTPIWTPRNTPRPSSIIPARSNSIRNSSRPISDAATPIYLWAIMTKPSTITLRRSNCTQPTPGLIIPVLSATPN